MTRIEKTLREIQDLREFYKRTEGLRAAIQQKAKEQEPAVSASTSQKNK